MPMSDNPAVQATQPLVAQIVSGYVRKNQVALADIATVINTVYQSLMSLGKAPEPIPQASAVSIRQSIRPTYVVCLECGVRGKMLRRHFRQAHGLEANGIEPSGGFRRITQSLLRVIPRHDPHSQADWVGTEN